MSYLNKKSMAGLLIELFRHADDPMLSSIKGLSLSAIESLIVRMKDLTTVTIADDKLTVEIETRELAKHIKNAVKKDIILDEAGMLIRYGASRNVIAEITGLSQRAIIIKRKQIKNVPTHGRLIELDETTERFVLSVWNKYNDKSKVLQLIRASFYSDVHINQVWEICKRSRLQSSNINGIGVCSNVYK